MKDLYPKVMDQSTNSSDVELPSISKQVFNISEEPINLQKITGDGKCPDCYCHNEIPKRYIFTFMGFLATTIIVSLQLNLSVAIVSMMDRSNESSTNSKSSNECIANQLSDEIVEEKTYSKGEFHWGPELEGLALGAVYCGQTVGSFPGGRLSELYGGKRVMITFVLLASILTILTPVAARTSVYIFIACRFLVGIGTASLFPSLYHLITRWIPEAESCFTSTLIFAGYGLGGFVAYLIAGLLCGSNFLGGWPSVFYVFGLIGIAWSFLFYILVSETPDVHPTISLKELDYISKNLGDTERKKIQNIPWKSIMLSVPFWSLIVGAFGQFWPLAFFATAQPLYMGTILGLDSKTNGGLSCLPQITRALLGCAVGYPADRALEKGYVTKGFIRKGATVINSLVVCIGFFGIVFSGCDPTLNTIFFIVGGATNEFLLFGTNMAVTDIAPNLTGTLSGIMAVFRTIPFFFIPALVGWLTKYERSMAQWHYFFYITFGVVITTTILYVIFGTSDPQAWGTDNEKKTEKQDNQTRDPSAKQE